MTESLKNKLIALANKYENKDFLTADPSKFMHLYTNTSDIECAAFISANLAFGRREQILKHIQIILDAAGKSPCKWILDSEYKKFFPQNNKSFYRMYSNNSMLSFFDTLNSILKNHKTLGNFIKTLNCQNPSPDLINLKDSKEEIHLCHKIAALFSQDCNLIPHTKDSACKKINLFLRWMVRDNSPVDMGLWTWYKKTDLLLPLDTHVMNQATELKMLAPTSTGKVQAASFKKAIALTRSLQEVFPDDPVKGDFALFGLGVNSK
ncbi:TIGR02757 family protein [Treponema sp.]|uniref:TIGR02757 family protein n=1 Tax=Treponema sp. TaxID=166 RepID=UPI0025EBB669|nr:TIGR02757 family protein [Treponema sp.]MCR5217463.1 TIGR02757 family protein [Treponema sp.]